MQIRNVVSSLIICAAALRCESRPPQAPEQTSGTAGDPQETLRLGIALKTQGRFREAEGQFQTTLRLGKNLNSPALQATALYYLATVNEDLGRVSDALRFCGRAESVLQKAFGPDDARLLKVRMEIATLYLAYGQLDAGEKVLRRVAAAQASAPAVPDLQRAETQDALATLYTHKKKFAVAEEHARRAIPILEGLKGAELQLASTSVHLASILDSRGHPIEALPYAKRSLEILSRVPNAEPVARAEAQMNLALLYAAIGRKAEADQSSQEAVALVQRVYGPDHPYSGWMLMACARVLRRLHRKEEAHSADRQGRLIVTASGQVERAGSTVQLTEVLVRSMEKLTRFKVVLPLSYPLVLEIPLPPGVRSRYRRKLAGGHRLLPTMANNRSTFLTAPQPISLTLRIEPHAKGEVFTVDKIERDGRATSESTILYLDGKQRDFQDVDCSGTQASQRVDSRTVEIVRTCATGEWTRFIRRLNTRELILEITERQRDGRRVERRLVLEKQ